MRRQTLDRVAPERDRSRCRPLQACDRPQQRALPGSVGTDDGDDLAVVDLERDPVDGRNAAEVLR
jgi:hypothetical protein